MLSTTAQRPAGRTTVRPLVLLALIVVNLSIIVSTLQHRLGQFITKDPKPSVMPITPATYAQFGGYPNTVQVGLYINKFETFSIVNNIFEFTGVIWFMYPPDAISLETLQKFTFERGQILYRSAPDTQLVDGQLMVKYLIRASLHSPFNYENFPLDNHRIDLALSNPFVSPSELLFSAAERTFVIKADTRAQGWQLADKTIRTGYQEAQLDPADAQQTMHYPVALFSLDYVRYGMRYVLSILMPLLLLFYLALFTLSWSPKSGYGGLSLTVGSITATLGYRFVIDNLSPKTGYFTIADYLFFLFLTVDALIFIAALIDHYARPLALWEKRFIALFLHAVTIGSCVYLFLFKA